MFVGKAIEVEAREGHDDVEESVLDGDEVACGEVEGQFAFVVGGPEGVEECGGDGEEGEVLDVGVTVDMGERLASVVATNCVHGEVTGETASVVSCLKSGTVEERLFSTFI